MLSENELVSLTEKILKNRVDIKYYRAVTSLLEKGYLLHDISAALLMSLTEEKAVPEKKGAKAPGVPKAKATLKKEPHRPAKKQDKPVKKTEKRKSGNVNIKKSQPVQKRFKPNTRKVKNENSNS